MRDERSWTKWHCWGRSNKEIAALMGVSVNTVKSYMESIFEKLQISSRNEIDAYVNR